MHKGTALLLLTSIFSLLLLISCASNSGLSTPEPANEKLAEQAVSIPKPVKSSYSYFSTIKKEILQLVEIGSPSSLREAASLLHKGSADDYEENEKVLLSVCYEIMKICWPSQDSDWEIPEAPGNNSYIGAINSVKNGIYDSSTGDTDFLALLLPSLVLLTSSTRTDYYDASSKALSQALLMNPNSILANYLAGILTGRQKKYEESLNYLTNAAVNAPDCLEIQIAQAKAFSAAGNYFKALEMGEELLEKNPQNIVLLEMCAQSSYNLHDEQKTERYVSRVLQIQPENSDYVLFRAKLLLNKNDFIKASSLLDVYSRTNQASREYLILRSRLLRDWNKNYTAAIDTIAQALQIYPDDIELLEFAAGLASETEKTVNNLTALQIAEKILAGDKNNLRALMICAEENCRTGNWNEAYNLCRQIMQKEAYPQEIYSTFITVCLELQKSEEAEELVTQLYADNPDNEVIQEQYLKVLVAFNRKQEGLKLIETLLSSANSKMKSNLYYEKSFFEDSDNLALNDLRSSLTANPRNKDSLFRLYEIYYNRGDWRKAQYYLKQVVALTPQNQKLLELNSQLDMLINQ